MLQYTSQMYSPYRAFQSLRSFPTATAALSVLFTAGFFEVQGTYIVAVLWYTTALRDTSRTFALILVWLLQVPLHMDKFYSI